LGEPSEAIVVAKNVCKNYGEVAAVKGVSFEIPPSTCFGLLGPNGAGKTTIMKMIYGKARMNPDCGGFLRVLGFDPAKDECEVKTRTGVVPQDNNLDEELDCYDNLSLYARFYGLPKKQAAEKIKQLLSFFELEEKASSRIRQLSGGMKRRLVIARALLNEPELLILDEPTTGLDPQVRHVIWDRLRKLKAEGTTILLTTHYMEEAYQLADRVLIMHEGQKVMEGKPSELVRSNVEEYVLEIVDAAAAGKAAKAAETPVVASGCKASAEADSKMRARVDNTHDLARIYSNDLDFLKKLSNSLGGSEHHLRQTNLEDVFLKATGSALGSGQ
jgi:lipooligosaccharide transport system ATP-binding protein